MASIPTWKKNSVLFLLSQTISQFGTAIVQYSIFWYITLSTKSGMILTLTIIVGLLPTFLLSPLAGVFADRYSKKKMIMISDGLIALVTLVLAVVFFNGYESLVLLLFITLIRAIGVGIQNPASSSLVPEFVPKEKLSSFNGVLTGTLSLMNIISPAVSGLLLNILSFDQILLIDVVTAVIGISLFYFIKVPGGRKEKSESYISDVKAGIGYIRKNSFLILLFVYFSINSQIEFLQKSQKISFCFLFIFQMKFYFISYRLEIQKRERKEIPHSVEKTKQSALINVFISGFLLLYFFLKFSFYKV